MTKRGAVLVPVEQKPQPTALPSHKVVRILTQGNIGGNFDAEIIRLSEQLQLHGIRLIVESCNPSRLKTIASQPCHAWEFCCLLSIPVACQKYFLLKKDSTLVIGFTNSESHLRYLTPDLNGSTRHAANSLLRQGFKHLVMFDKLSKTVGVARCCQTFKSLSEKAQDTRCLSR